MIAQADRVFCVGVSNSGYVAQYAARYFSGFGKFSMAITDPFYHFFGVALLLRTSWKAVGM